MGFTSRHQTPERVPLWQIYFEYQGIVHAVCGIYLYQWLLRSFFQRQVRHVISPIPPSSGFQGPVDSQSIQLAIISFTQFDYLLLALVDGQCRENIRRFLYSEMTGLNCPNISGYLLVRLTVSLMCTGSNRQ